MVSYVTCVPQLHNGTNVLNLSRQLVDQICNSVYFGYCTSSILSIVYLSSLSVRDDLEQQADPITAFHADIERLIEQSGLEWTFPRASGIATNTLGCAQ